MRNHRQQHQHQQQQQSVPFKQCCSWLFISATIAAGILVFSFATFSASFLPCSIAAGAGLITPGDPTPTHLHALLHYATSNVVPQQSFSEIRITFDVLRSLSPCNFLVFGLGHDSLMWSAFNSAGNTLFLEEDPSWVQSVLRSAPNLHAHSVRYPTHLSEAEDLLASYRSDPECSLPIRTLRGSRCRLALSTLPEEVYDTEWDVIMIDAPRGYYDSAPGRMGAIFSAAVMARNRGRAGVTHVYLHDVNRRVEKVYAETFLCRKNLVKAVERLWHFEIPAASAAESGGGFC